jgi:hypothetical protein
MLIRFRLLLLISLAFTAIQRVPALDIPMDQVVLKLPLWTGMPDRKSSSGTTQKCAKSSNGKILVNAWVSSAPKATVEHGVIFFLLGLVASESDLRQRANTLKISSADVDLILGMAKSSNYPIGKLVSQIDEVGVHELGGRNIYYVLSQANERGDATLYMVTQGRTPQTSNTAIFSGPPESLKNTQYFATMFQAPK